MALSFCTALCLSSSLVSARIVLHPLGLHHRLLLLLQVYRVTVEPLVHTLFNNGKATCFAYGQTGSGKTYTMSPLPIRAADDILRYLERPELRDVELYVSCFEIYGNKVFDLLNMRKKLNILEDGKKKVCVVGLKVREGQRHHAFAAHSLFVAKAAVTFSCCLQHRAAPARGRMSASCCNRTEAWWLQVRAIRQGVPQAPTLQRVEAVCPCGSGMHQLRGRSRAGAA